MNQLPEDLIEAMKSAYDLSQSEDWNEGWAQQILIDIAKIYREIYID